MEPRKGLTISEPGFLMHLECSLLLVGLVTSVLYQLLDGTLVIAFKIISKQLLHLQSTNALVL